VSDCADKQGVYCLTSMITSCFQHVWILMSRLSFKWTRWTVSSNYLPHTTLACNIFCLFLLLFSRSHTQANLPHTHTIFWAKRAPALIMTSNCYASLTRVSIFHTKTATGRGWSHLITVLIRVDNSVSVL